MTGMMYENRLVRVSELVAALSPRVTVLAGESGLGGTVRWVHATDLADPSPYLKGGELVLTNGQWRRRAADSRRFVASVEAAESAAIGYGLQRFGTSTPKDLVAACEAAGMPLLEIPHDMRFVEISELVATHYADERQSRLMRRLRRSEALLTSVTGGAGVEEILAMLAHDHDLDLMLVDHAGQVLGGSAPQGRKPAAAALARAVAGVAEPVGAEVEGSDVMVFPVVVQGAVEAFLVCFRAAGALSADERAAISHELVFVGLELSHALATRELTEQLVDELLEMIAGGDSRAPEVAGRLRSLGLDPSREMAVIALLADAHHDPETVRRMARIAVLELRARAVPAIAPVQGPTAFVLVNPDRAAAEVAAELVEALLRQGTAVSAGVGSEVSPGVQQLRRSVAESRLAADFAQVRGGAVRVATYAEAGSFRVLLAAQPRDAQLAFAEAVLGPILEQDRTRGTQLVQTLEAFLRSSGQWQRVADALHLHVNTLRYRIGKVEQLTGRPLSSFEERVNFYVALEALGSQVGAGQLEVPPN